MCNLKHFPLCNAFAYWDFIGVLNVFAIDCPDLSEHDKKLHAEGLFLSQLHPHNTHCIQRESP